MVAIDTDFNKRLGRGKKEHSILTKNTKGTVMKIKAIPNVLMKK